MCLISLPSLQQGLPELCNTSPLPRSAHGGGARRAVQGTYLYSLQHSDKSPARIRNSAVFMPSDGIYRPNDAPLSPGSTSLPVQNQPSSGVYLYCWDHSIGRSGAGRGQPSSQNGEPTRGLRQITEPAESDTDQMSAARLYRRHFRVISGRDNLSRTVPRRRPAHCFTW